MSQTLAHCIPAAQIAAVEAALQQAFGTTDVTEISLLAGGLSAAAVYKITVQEQTYVLKLNAAAGIAPAAAGNLQLAAGAGIAPPLYFQDAASGIAISGFIHNKPVRTAWEPAKLVAELAATIRAIHRIPCHTGGNDLRATIDGMIERFRQSNLLRGPVPDECYSGYEKIRQVYPWDDADKVFSHNDLNPNNILCDGERIWIIDWDAAFLNDRYVDLANAANFFVHTPEQENAFLHSYFNQAADAYQLARFYLMRQLCRVIYAMLMFQLAAQARPADYAHSQEMEGMSLAAFGALMGAGKLSLASYEGQFMYGKALLNEAVQQMRTSRFAASLALLA